ncbi:hypothetical protein SO694_00046128 [Aureococcus anophagefferens]|uniref:Polycystin cation channel PKD1/PKD2 domain-containing protein n=1 Tax=Aureococcus anophagefferens TaxID=44056 RepID=A0ABR1G887_AURAN
MAAVRSRGASVEKPVESIEEAPRVVEKPTTTIPDAEEPSSLVKFIIFVHRSAISLNSLLGHFRFWEVRSDKHLFDGLTCGIFIRSLLRVVTYLLVVSECAENEVKGNGLLGRDCAHYHRLQRWFHLDEEGESFSVNVAFYNFVILCFQEALISMFLFKANCGAIRGGGTLHLSGAGYARLEFALRRYSRCAWVCIGFAIACYNVARDATLTEYDFSDVMWDERNVILLITRLLMFCFNVYIIACLAVAVLALPMDAVRLSREDLWRRWGGRPFATAKRHERQAAFVRELLTPRCASSEYDAKVASESQDRSGEGGAWSRRTGAKAFYKMPTRVRLALSLSLIMTVIIVAAGSYGFVVVDKLVTRQMGKVGGYVDDMREVMDLTNERLANSMDVIQAWDASPIFDGVDRLVADHTDGVVDGDFANATAQLVFESMQDILEDYEDAFEYAFDTAEFVLKFFEKCSKFVMPSMYLSSHVTFATTCYSLWTFKASYESKTLQFRATDGTVNGEALLGRGDGEVLLLVRASKAVSLVGLLCSNSMILCLSMLLTTLSTAFSVQLALSFGWVPRMSLRYVWTQFGIWITGTFLEAVIIDGILTESAHVVHHAAFDFFDFLFCYWNVVYGYIQGLVRLLLIGGVAMSHFVRMDKRVIHGTYSKWLDPGYNAFTSTVVLHETQCNPVLEEACRLLLGNHAATAANAPGLAHMADPPSPAPNTVASLLDGPPGEAAGARARARARRRRVAALQLVVAMTVSPPPPGGSTEPFALRSWNAVELGRRPLPSKARQLLAEDGVFGRARDGDDVEAGASLLPVFQRGNLLTAFKLMDRSNTNLASSLVRDVALSRKGYFEHAVVDRRDDDYDDAREEAAVAQGREDLDLGREAKRVLRTGPNRRAAAARVRGAVPGPSASPRLDSAIRDGASGARLARPTPRRGPAGGRALAATLNSNHDSGVLDQVWDVRAEPSFDFPEFVAFLTWRLADLAGADDAQRRRRRRTPCARTSSSRAWPRARRRRRRSRRRRDAPSTRPWTRAGGRSARALRRARGETLRKEWQKIPETGMLRWSRAVGSALVAAAAAFLSRRFADARPPARASLHYDQTPEAVPEDVAARVYLRLLGVSDAEAHIDLGVVAAARRTTLDFDGFARHVRRLGLSVGHSFWTPGDVRDMWDCMAFVAAGADGADGLPFDDFAALYETRLSLDGAAARPATPTAASLRAFVDARLARAAPGKAHDRALSKKARKKAAVV